MYILNYIPVNIGKPDAAVYTDKYTFPVDLLLDTVEKIKKKGKIKTNDEDEYFSYSDNYITFKHKREVRWCVSDIYLAYEAYMCALENNFSFSSVTNMDGVPRLFVSKEFKKTRIVVNPLTMQAVMINDISILRHITSILRKSFSDSYCLTLFDVLCKREVNKSAILDAIILWRDNNDEALVVNPVTTMYSEYENFYGVEWIEAMRDILDNGVTQNDYCEKNGDFITRRDITYMPALPLKHCQYIVDMYDRYKAKKSDYCPITGPDYETHFYVSTNYMYIVDAFTFECFKVTNQQLKDLLTEYVSKETNPISAMIELRCLLANQ